MTSPPPPSCDTCAAPYEGRGEWNGTFQGGVLVGLTCPGCQTPEQNAEAEINAATTKYEVGPFGLVYSTPIDPHDLT